MSRTIEKDTKDKNEGPRSFAVLLTKLRDGEVEAELSEALQKMGKQLAELAYETGKSSGALTLTLSFKADRDGTVDVIADVKLKEPKKKQGRGVFWLTPHGNFAAENPRQTTLPLRPVPAAEPTRDVGGDNVPARSV